VINIEIETRIGIGIAIEIEIDTEIGKGIIAEIKKEIEKNVRKDKEMKIEPKNVKRKRNCQLPNERL